jgi:hypothetical protein
MAACGINGVIGVMAAAAANGGIMASQPQQYSAQMAIMA